VALHIVYRSTGGENRKSRPPYYSKTLALASFLRAVDQLDEVPEILFVNDGPIPADRLELMRGRGELIPIHGGDARRSYRAAVALAARRDWPDGDLVWFAEDDYLYTPAALRLLLAAGRALRHADYLSMHGFLALDTAAPRTRPAPLPLPRSEGVRDVTEIDGVRWYRGMSTTSTFAVRTEVLAADRRLLRLVPWSGGAWDFATCMTYQGLQPFEWSHVRAELMPFRREPFGSWPRAMWRGAFRAVVNVRARRRPGNRRTFYAADPEPISHMEEPNCADGFDWFAHAHSTRVWAQARGARLSPWPSPGRAQSAT